MVYIFRAFRKFKIQCLAVCVGVIGCTGGPALTADAQVRVLFVGNSFTHGYAEPVLKYNTANIRDENADLSPSSPRHESDGTGPWGGVPGIFKKFTDEAGLAYEVHLELINGSSLENHYNVALPVIQQSRWDKVVLQEQSTRPLPTERSGQPSLFFSYATQLEQKIHSANAQANVYLYQTWARADLTYPASQPYSGLAIEAMTTDLHDAYKQLLTQNSRFMAVAPIGDAWVRAIQAGVATRNPYTPTAGQLNLWATDRYHASKWGSYLAACVLFYQLTARDPRTLGGTEQAAAALDIRSADAVALQQIAYQQVRASGAPLPVTLTTFAAQRRAAGVALRWATASETNNREFEVQRSADGQLFAVLGRVAGQGSTATAHAYAFDDYLAPTGPLYYRLRQVDTGGQGTFSPVVAVAAGASAALFPNPAHQFLHIAAPSATRYRVRNQLGQLLLQGALTDGSATVELQALPIGIYQVELDTNAGPKTQRLVRE